MASGSPDAAVPEGFAPLFRTSPFLDTLGPFFYRPLESGFVIGVRIAEKHANARGVAHGGFLVTLADVALGYTVEAAADPPLRLATVSISADFVGRARVGEWVEAQVDVQRIGERLVFANAFLVAAGKRVTRVSGVFARIGES